MGKIKEIHRMFSGGASVDTVAWHLMLTTKIGGWHEAKRVAKNLERQYISSGEDIDGNNE